MSWIIRIPDGPEINSDDYTLDDLDKIEKATGTYWSVMNPFREAKVAKEFLRVAYTHAGRDVTEVDSLTMKSLKSMFDFVPDEPLAGEETPTKARKGQTRRSSSDGAQTGTAGLQPLLESSA